MAIVSSFNAACRASEAAKAPIYIITYVTDEGTQATEYWIADPTGAENFKDCLSTYIGQLTLEDRLVGFQRLAEAE